MITGINIVRNCIENGYPFAEAILSAYPMCSEYLVNDGGSTDDTLETLTRLAKVYPKIKIFNIPDTENTRWDCVSNQINHMIQQSRNGIIFLGNADELIHEKDLTNVKEQALSMVTDVLRFDRREIKPDWSKLSEEVYHPARIAVNYANVRQDWNAYGGDEFLYDHGWPDPERQSRLNVTLYHLYNMFPANRLNKLRNDAEHLAPGDVYRVSAYKRFKDTKASFKPPQKIYDGLPALARGLAYMDRYYVRECLYKKDWVERVTGLSYST